MRRGMRHMTAHERAREIMREEYARMERAMLAHIPHCKKNGHPERADEWARGAAWARVRWQETLDG